MSAFSCERFYSHPNIELRRHLSEVGKLCREYVASVANSKLSEAAEIIGKCHDVAKYTPFFQKHLSGERVHGDLSTHSKLSAIFTSWLLSERLGDPFLTAAGFICVGSHHGNLKSFSLLERADPARLGEPVIMEQVKSIKNSIDKVSGELGEIGLQEFADFIGNFDALTHEISRKLKSAAAILRFRMSESERWRSYYNTLLMFSALVDADKKDAGRVEAIGQKTLPSDLVSKYIERKFASADPSRMNALRKSVFSEVNEQLTLALNGGSEPRIVTITLPTGTGKTLLGIHTALKISETLGYTRVVYCLPYINIIEQTHAVMEDVLSTYCGRKPDISMLLKHHHLFFPSQESKDVPLDKLLLLTDSWESSFIITTFEQLLRSIIGCRNSMLKKFHNLAGSILILDEVQAIPLEYWRLVRDALLHMAENFDMKIIMMTATMPAIFRGESVKLVPEPEKYFKHMDRTELIPRLEKAVTAEEFADFFLAKWTKGASALLVVNTVRASKKVYERLVERLGDEAIRVGLNDESADHAKTVLAYLSTSIIPVERKRRIKLLNELLKERRSVILVSTQVVEAGVDLDFDVAFRDLGPFDSIVQVAGRCNRNWRLPTGRIYVLRIVDENGREDSRKIYGGILPERTMELIASKESIKEHELAELMKPYYEDVSYRMNVEKHPECMKLLERIKALDFRELAHFSLIEEEPKVPVYVEYDGEAERLLKEFREALNALEREEVLEKVFELKAALRRIRAEMENYIVEVYENEPCLKSLKPITVQANVLLVPREENAAYYDPETGFKTTMESKFLMF